MGRCSSVRAALKRNFIAYPRELWASHHCLKGPAMTMGDDRPGLPNWTQTNRSSRSTNGGQGKSKVQTEYRHKTADKRHKFRGNGELFNISFMRSFYLSVPGLLLWVFLWPLAGMSCFSWPLPGDNNAICFLLQWLHAVPMDFIGFTTQNRLQQYGLECSECNRARSQEVIIRCSILQFRFSAIIIMKHNFNIY